ncbi:hypothetical protein [Actinocrispum sp. NPDC049592]|uniref:hypothetical protein n=1 Tax=Actinocrispum sp. NPDC049592 TaxID=3154835 RepID=UPI00343C796D
MVVASLFGLSVQAQAAPQAQGGTIAVQAVGDQLQVSSTAPDGITIQSSFTFSKETTQTIYDVATTGGPIALTALCNAIAPGWLAPACSVVVPIIMSYITSNPPNGRCLEVSTKWTPPFFGIRYVNC